MTARALGGRQNGTGWLAPCPLHEDRTPSLSIRDRPGGGFLVKCHAGCDQNAVFAAAIDAAQGDARWASWGQWPQNGKRTKASESYEYCDADGRLLYTVHRLPGKQFRQQRADGEWSMKGVTRVPYRLPDWIEGSRVLIAEGERDVETLRTFGIPATCNSGGAGNWPTEISPYFADMAVTILPDNDDAGRKHARKVAAALEGIAAEVRILELPDLPEKGDVSDWFAKGGTPAQLDSLLPAAVPANKWRCDVKQLGVELKTLGQLRAEPPRDIGWLVPQLLPANGLSLIVASPKAGKSTLVRCLSVATATGGEWLGRHVTQGVVVHLALEERSQTVLGHYDRLGAPDEGIHLLLGGTPAPEQRLDWLRAAITETRAALVPKQA